MPSDRFARFLPLAGVLAGLLLAAGLTLTYSIPNSETSFEETFSWWRDNRGQHQIPGLLLAPLVALMLIFFGAGLQRSLRSNTRDSGQDLAFQPFQEGLPAVQGALQAGDGLT